MNRSTIKIIINCLSIMFMLMGAFGMLYSFPYLWTGSMFDIVGAGLPFVAGSVLLGTGLISLAIFNKDSNVANT